MVVSSDRSGIARPLILSVDDDEINQEVVRSSLGRACQNQPRVKLTREDRRL